MPGGDLRRASEGRHHAGTDPQGRLDRHRFAVGTLTYEAVYQLTQRGIGQSTAIGIGGDPIVGTTHVDALQLLNEDRHGGDHSDRGDCGTAKTRGIREEAREEAGGGVHRGTDGASRRRMGHAGAIISGGQERRPEKMKALKAAGIHVVETPAAIGETVARVIGK